MVDCLARPDDSRRRSHDLESDCLCASEKALPVSAFEMLVRCSMEARLPRARSAMRWQCSGERGGFGLPFNAPDSLDLVSAERDLPVRARDIFLFCSSVLLHFPFREIDNLARVSAEHCLPFRASGFCASHRLTAKLIFRIAASVCLYESIPSPPLVRFVSLIPWDLSAAIQRFSADCQSPSMVSRIAHRGFNPASSSPHIHRAE